jgi:predicted homoserine dehydrogenase-like protein
MLGLARPMPYVYTPLVLIVLAGLLQIIGAWLGPETRHVAVTLRGEATGAPVGFQGDVAAIAKRDLASGERLDGEGGYTVHGHLMRAADALSSEALPIGLAHGVTLVRAVGAGDLVRWSDVRCDSGAQGLLTTG